MKNYTVEHIDPNHLCFHFTIPFAQLSAAVDTLYQSSKDQFSVPGMRKGKASRQLIESHYGKTVFSAPALEKVVTDAYCKAASEYPQEIYYTPTVKIEQNEPEKDLIFSARVQIEPEIRLGDYHSAVVTDADLAEITQTVADVPKEEQDATRHYLLQAALVEQIAQKSSIEIPDTMINERAMQMARTLEQRLQADQKSIEDYFEECHTSKEALLNDFAKAAKAQLRSRLTLFAIARAEGLTATEEEYTAELNRLSQMYMIPVEQLRNLLAQREEWKIRQDIAISKAADWIGTRIGTQDKMPTA